MNIGFFIYATLLEINKIFMEQN